MSYVVLARKYRPRSFAQMVGQEHVVQALTNALTQGRLHHAYLFTGTRGIGKTTVSRILAKSLNCTGPDGQGGITATPCGRCQACTEIDADRYIDYIELDAASNRSIDEIRDLIERAAYKPGIGRYKVFMIDEAHQLTKDAFSALLNTLEEPPEYLKFVLATTDPHKMLPTVLSRCLQFNLRPMAPATVRDHLRQVLASEGVPFDDGSLRLLDKESGRELVDTAAPHRLGQMVVRDPDGGERTARLLRARKAERGAVSTALELDYTAPGHPRIRQVFRLLAGQKEIELAVNVLKDATPLLEAHLAFPFDLPGARWRYEGVLSTLTPVEDFMPGAQSDRLSVQNWALAQSENHSLLWAALDAPVASLGGLWEGYVSPAHRCRVPAAIHAHRRLRTEDFQRGWIYSLLFANNFGTNFAVTQPGCALFRYRFAVNAGAVSRAEAAAWGQAAVTGLEPALIPGAPARPAASLARVEGARLLACKAAEDGHGWILRLWNPGEAESRCRVAFSALRPTAAWVCNLAEEDEQALELDAGGLEVLLPAGGVRTLRVRVAE